MKIGLYYIYTSEENGEIYTNLLIPIANTSQLFKNNNMDKTYAQQSNTKIDLRIVLNVNTVLNKQL